MAGNAETLKVQYVGSIEVPPEIVRFYETFVQDRLNGDRELILNWIDECSTDDPAAEAKARQEQLTTLMSQVMNKNVTNAPLENASHICQEAYRQGYKEGIIDDFQMDLFQRIIDQSRANNSIFNDLSVEEVKRAISQAVKSGDTSFGFKREITELDGSKKTALSDFSLNPREMFFHSFAETVLDGSETPPKPQGLEISIDELFLLIPKDRISRSDNKSAAKLGSEFGKAVASGL